MSVAVELPADLARATLAELPPRWALVVTCPCRRGHSAAVWFLVDCYGWDATLGRLLSRMRCRTCKAQPVSAVLREAPPPGRGTGGSWTPREAPVAVPPPDTVWAKWAR